MKMMKRAAFLCAGVVTLSGPVTSLAAEAPIAVDMPSRILIAGDSTAADYPPSRAPQVGWGQALPHFLADSVEVVNLAVNGRSTKSFIDEGKWSALVRQIEPGDLVLISFGHNDSRDDSPERYAAPLGAYRENLERFVSDVREQGGAPILLSPAARRLWEGPAMVETHGLYAYAANEAATASHAHSIDLANLTIANFERLGREETKRDYIWLTQPNWRTGEVETREDNTHFSHLGACGVAFVLAGKLSALIDGDILDAPLERLPDISTDACPEAVLACADALDRAAAAAE